MSCDHKIVEDYLFEYLDQTLAPSLTRAVEQAIDGCPECKATYLAAAEAQQMERHWQEQPVPEWHRTRFAVAKPTRVSWQWMNGLSLATSALAIMLVLFRVEFISTDTGLTVSFAGKGSKAEVTDLINQHMSQIALEQVKYIDNRFREQKLQMVSDNQQMVNTLLAHNRQERRQDMNTLMASWLKQRDQDQAKINQRVDYVVDNQIENNKVLNQVMKVSN
ncbi:MAG: anti-sigma factor [Kangiellaceae bacterium]|jgi:hypothetical protein|nr:anti-sigma factor [Kangiellaceae bacterium]